MKANLINFDSIVGPTHNYSGLSLGNLASTTHGKMVSSPKKAALQGLEKMKFLHDLGIKQAVLPPQDRPNIDILKRLGFEGSDAEIMEKAYKSAPKLFFRCCSASAMWAANIATTTPSCDSADQNIHITPANLITMFHRSIEPRFTYTLLQKIFNDSNYFKLHEPLPKSLAMADEGAANHTLLCPEYGESGIHLFIYNTNAFDDRVLSPKKFPGRQTLQASEAIARIHGIFPNHIFFLQQNPEAVDAGVFHNDVIAVGDRNLFLYHEKAYVNTAEEISNLGRIFEQLCDRDLKTVVVKESELSLKEAVDSYLFNSQLILLPEGKTALIAPTECREMEKVQNLLNEWVKDANNPIDIVRYIDVRESMSNGGGPACLRLPMIMNENEIGAMHQGVLFTEELYAKLVSWVEKHYRDTLDLSELVDPELLKENRKALDELTKILKLGSIYSFQGMEHAITQ